MTKVRDTKSILKGVSAQLNNNEQLTQIIDSNGNAVSVSSNSLDVNVTIAGTDLAIGAGLEAAALLVTLPTDGTGVVHLSTGESHIGSMGGNTSVIKLTGANVNAAGATYTANDIVGDGTNAIELTAAMRVTSGSAVLQTVIIHDLAIQDAELDIYFFDADPSNGTYTDQAALDIHDTDMTFCVGSVNVAAGDYKDAADSSVATVKSIGLAMASAATDDLWVIFQTRGTPTYVADCLSATFVFLQD